MRCLAIDDEPLALAQLMNYISLVPFLTLIKGCEDSFEAMKIMADEEIDLIYTDINMPDLSGIDFVKSMVSRPLIIFTTAYPEYAVEGFKMEVTDYLLKPFDFQEFLKATDKARKQWDNRMSESPERNLTTTNNALFIKSEDKIYRTSLNTIRYIEKKGEYVRIFTEDSIEPLTSLMHIDILEEKLPDNFFIRIHSNYIINMEKIKEVARFRHVLMGDKYIPIDEIYRNNFIEYIQNRCIGK